MEINCISVNVVSGIGVSSTPASIKLVSGSYSRDQDASN